MGIKKSIHDDPAIVVGCLCSIFENSTETTILLMTARSRAFGIKLVTLNEEMQVSQVYPV